MDVADVLIEAIRAGKMAAIRAALKAKPAAARQPRPMVEAARAAFQGALELLHKGGGDLNASWRNYRPLHALMQEDPHAEAGKPSAERLACLEWLLEHGADPEQLGGWPSARAVIIAGFSGVPEYVDRLRAAGCAIDGFAAAALGDRAAAARALRGRPQLARECDRGGLTALQCAAGSRMPGGKGFEIARLLIEAGADVKAKTKSWSEEVDAVYFAVASNQERTFKLLLEHGADPTEALGGAVRAGRDRMAETALARGGSLDRATANGKPLLNDLIRRGQLKKAMWALAHGASPNVADADGWTALHQAVSRGSKEMVRALLDAGADPAARDRQGRTPADLAGRKKIARAAEMLRS
jgi:hypothetical protein